jgi:hypothetical protein
MVPRGKEEGEVRNGFVHRKQTNIQKKSTPDVVKLVGEFARGCWTWRFLLLPVRTPECYFDSSTQYSNRDNTFKMLDQTATHARQEISFSSSPNPRVLFGFQLPL